MSANAARSIKRRHHAGWWLACAAPAAVAVALCSPANAQSDAPPPPPPPLSLPKQAPRATAPFSNPLAGNNWLPFQLRSFPAVSQKPGITLAPTVTVREEVTDNVNLSAGDRKFESITTIDLGFDVSGETRRSRLSANGIIGYQKFLSASDFDTLSVAFSGLGQVELVKRLLFVDARASVSDILNDPGVSASTSRNSTVGRSRVTTYDAGPYLTTKVADLFDIYARARRARVEFQGVDNATLPPGLVDATFDQLNGQITTGNHVRRFQMIASGDYLKQSQGFRQYNGIYTLIYGAPNALQAVGQFGYENIFDPGITDLQGAIWSAGLVAHPRQNGSFLRVEYGHRYNKPTWSVSGNVIITPKIVAVVTYQRLLETEQARIRRTYSEILGQPNDPYPGPPVLPTPILPALIAGTYLSDDSSVGLSWLISPPLGPTVRLREPASHNGTYLTVVAGNSLRRGLSSNTNARDRGVTVRYYRDLARQMSLTVDLGWVNRRTFLPVPEEFQEYRTEFNVDYYLTRTVRISGIYTWHQTAPRGASKVTENTIGISVGKAF